MYIGKSRSRRRRKESFRIAFNRFELLALEHEAEETKISPAELLAIMIDVGLQDFLGRLEAKAAEKSG